MDLDENLPERMRQGLKGLYAHHPAVPGAVDSRVRAAAQRELLAHGTWHRWAWGSAAAAAIVAASVWMALQHGGEARPPIAARNSGTILAAFELARDLKTHVKLGPEWDANGDGVVDQKDVDLLARHAVALKGGTL